MSKHYGDGFGDDGFGWNGMGDPMGGTWHPAFGAVTGGAVQSGAAIAARQFSDNETVHKYAEAIGLGAAAVPAVAAVFYGPSRAAGWTALAAAASSGIPRLLEDVLIRYADGGSGTKGVGMPSIQRVGRTVGTGARGTGMPVAERTRTVGAAREPRLLGPGDRQASLRLIGAPGMAGHFGSSIAGIR